MNIFNHRDHTFLDLIFLNIFFLSISFLIYLTNYIYLFQLGKLNFFYFNLINFIFLPILFSLYYFIRIGFIYKFFITINIIFLSFVSSRMLYFFLLKNNLVFFNEIIFFLLLLIFYLFFSVFFLKKIDKKKKIYITIIYILFLFFKFPYSHLVSNKFEKDLNINNITKSKPPVIILIFDEVSRQFIIDENGYINKRYSNLEEFEKKNLSFTNAHANYAFSNQLFYSFAKGETYPSSKNRNIIHYLQIEKDKNNLFNDFYKKEYEINIFSHLIFCSNEKFFCKKPINNSNFLLAIYKKVISTLVPDNIESIFFPFLFQKKLDYKFFNDFKNLKFENNNLYFFHTLIAHKPWVLNEELSYIRTPNYKFKSNNKEFALQNYDIALKNLDEILGNFFFKLKKDKVFDEATIIVMSDHGICAEDYCRNRVEQLTSYNDYLSNVLLIIKHQDLAGSFTKEFDTINLRKLVSDLIFDNSFSNESEYKNYDFYNKFNEAIIKIK